jgi:hypothetical protein
MNQEEITTQEENVPTTDAKENPSIEPQYAVDIDFETYEVPQEKAHRIREELALLKNKSSLGDLFDWVQSAGEFYYPDKEKNSDGGASQEELIAEGDPVKRVKWDESSPLANLVIYHDGIECEIHIKEKKFCAFQKLPKANEILISHFESTLMPDFLNFEEELSKDLKAYAKAKAEKAKAFQEKFNKNKKEN